MKVLEHLSKTFTNISHALCKILKNFVQWNISIISIYHGGTTFNKYYTFKMDIYDVY